MSSRTAIPSLLKYSLAGSEITVLRAQYVCLTDDGRLHNDNVVHITNGRSDERIQFHKFRGLVEEIDLVENKVLVQLVERL
jgi:hypothetical protein